MSKIITRNIKKITKQQQTFGHALVGIVVDQSSFFMTPIWQYCLSHFLYIRFINVLDLLVFRHETLAWFDDVVEWSTTQAWILFFVIFAN